VLEIVGREADGDRRCAPVGCGTVLSRSADRLGVWTCADWRGGQSPGFRNACGDAVASIVVAARASWRASASACSWHRPAGAPFGPS
jgi:hypothetical protein